MIAPANTNPRPHVFFRGALGPGASETIMLNAGNAGIIEAILMWSQTTSDLGDGLISVTLGTTILLAVSALGSNLQVAELLDAPMPIAALEPLVVAAAGSDFESYVNVVGTVYGWPF